MEGYETSNGMASVYSEAKGEYTKQLTVFLVPALHRFFMGCLQQAQTEEPQIKRQLWKFQELLSQVPEWNMDKVQREVQRIQSEIQCDYLEELVTAVFVAHTKVLTAIRIGNKNKRVQITIPRLEHFLHRCLSECSRLLWSSAYLFHTDCSPIEKQKNHRQVEQLLVEGIMQAIRALLPVKNILKDYLAEPEDEAEEGDDEHDDEHAQESNGSVSAAPPVSAPEPATEPVPEPIAEPIAEPVPEPAPAPILAQEALPTEPITIESLEQISEIQSEPIMQAELPAPAPVPAPIQIPAPVLASLAPVSPAVPTPTLVVETEPSVRFTSYDQVIQQRGNTTHFDYVEKDRDNDSVDDEDFIFQDDDDGESLSSFEDLTEYKTEPLGADDFETI